jgi:EpsI family protein
MAFWEHAGQRRIRQALSLLLPVSILAAYSHTIGAVWLRWFPAWAQNGKSIYQRIVGGESYYSHGPLTVLVSVVIAVLLVRHTRIALRPRPRLGAALLLAFLLLHLTACAARITFVSAFSLIGALAALILMLWGAEALRRLWFALAVLAFAVPLPEVSIAELNFRLKMMAAEWGVSLANVLGVITVRSGNQVFLEGDKELVIANVCSGLRTLISLLAFAAIYVYVCQLRGWWRGVLLALSLPVAVASNAVRILSLILIAEFFGADAAVGWFHTFSGVMLFAMAVAMMFGLERLILLVRRLAGRPLLAEPLFHNVRRGPQDAGQWRRLAGALEAGAASAATAVLLMAGAASWYLLRSATPACCAERLKAVLPTQLEIDGQKFRSNELTVDERTLAVLETPEYVYRRYVSEDGRKAPLDFCLIRSRDNRKGLHPPDLCLEGAGQSIISKADVTVPAVPGRGDLPCRELIVQAGSQLHYYLYIYKCGGTYTRSFWRQQLVVFSNGLLSRNSAGALIRISTPTTGQTLNEARRLTFALLRLSVPHVDLTLP